MSTQIITAEQETQAFELVQRQAKLLASSTLVPKEFQGNMGNCAIALNIAKRLGADPFMVVQNVDVIHGRPSFRATFLIAMVNASGRFTPLQFRMSGDGQGRTCVAHAKDKETGETVEGPEVSMAMAKAEGWSTKNGSKWLTMPELMLRYRAAAFFARLYAPDITLGMQTAEELADTPTIRDVTPLAASNPLARENPFINAPGDNDPEPEAVETPAFDEARAEQVTEIRQACREAEITEASFEGKARVGGWMPKSESLGTVTDETLTDLWTNREAIIAGGKKP